MNLPIEPPYPPMEAKQVDDIPAGPNWQYEPKWDGFRCLAFKDGDEVFLQSKSCKPLARYFPEMARTIAEIPADRFVLDGELAIPVEGRLSFDALLLRIHPAESRVNLLAKETPSVLIVFDLLVEDGKDLSKEPLRERRRRLEAFCKNLQPRPERLHLSPATTEPGTAAKWFGGVGGSLDGIVAKRLDLRYCTGDRKGMEKIKAIRTVDCVVGGFRWSSRGRQVGSMLLGLYDVAGLLHHVGFTAAIKESERQALTDKLTPLIQAPGFTGGAPGGPSRWSTDRSTEWEPLRPELVVEVTYDHFTGGRFRHGTDFQRWRPDKAPEQCTFDQLEPEGEQALELLRGLRD